jgi:uncharacterized phage protein gp47/JayE
MNFYRRSYQEVLDNLLTVLLGGVAAEPHAFPLPSADNPYSYHLKHAAVKDVISVFGSYQGQTHLFKKGNDYKTEDAMLTWQSEGQLPDAGSVFYVNYRVKTAQAEINDLHEGSVVRTLLESIGIEIARLYAQLEVVYQAGFIDTATGSALDQVVALLDVQRIPAGRFNGELEFSRAPQSRGLINIPARTQVMTADGNVVYETISAITLLENQDSIRVMARDVETNNNAKAVEANLLTVLAKPIAGIAGVTNPSATVKAKLAETDEELRLRAKQFLHGHESATLGALKTAIAKQGEGLLADVIEMEDAPGQIAVTLYAEKLAPEIYQRVQNAIEEVRPAGIKVMPLRFNAPCKLLLALFIATAKGLLEVDLQAIQKTVREKISEYLNRRPTAEALSLNKIIATVLNIPGVEDVQIQSAKLMDGKAEQDLLVAGFDATRNIALELDDLQITDPNMPTHVDIVMQLGAGANVDVAELEKKIRDAFESTLAYINSRHAEGLLTPLPLTINYSQLLYITPVPDKAEQLQGSWIDFETQNATLELPTETDILPHTVKFAFTRFNKPAQALTKQQDAPYSLQTRERLSLQTVKIIKGGN